MLPDQKCGIIQCTVDGFGISYGITADLVLVNLVPLIQILEKCTKLSNFTLKKIQGGGKKKKSLKHDYAIMLSYSHVQKADS